MKNIRLVFLLVVFLAGCGGGDPDPDELRTVDPPRCSQQPQRCT